MARWEKGSSGNPGGRPKEIGDLRIMARERTDEALNTLTAIMRDKRAPHAARVSAACAILDRGYGRPPQNLELTGLNGGEIEVKRTSDVDAARAIAFLMHKALKAKTIENDAASSCNAVPVSISSSINITRSSSN